MPFVGQLFENDQPFIKDFEISENGVSPHPSLSCLLNASGFFFSQFSTASELLIQFILQLLHHVYSNFAQ